MSVQINGTNGLTFNDGSTQNTSPFAGGLGFRNRIINGACMIDQRNAGASVTNTAGTVYTVDRWSVYGAQASKLTVQQNAGSVTPPAGFTKYLGVTVASAYTPSSGENFNLQQPIEGLNVADLAWATANAAPVTVSFWARSSLTGTFTGSLISGGYSYVYPFTISSANTWTYVTATISGKTVGTFPTDNGTSIAFYINLGAGASLQTTTGSWQSGSFTSTSGAVSLVANAGATFYITGVQLEKGSTATSFDYRPYGTELALCQRYYEKFTNDSRYLIGYYQEGAYIYTPIQFLVEKRATPTTTLPSASTFDVWAVGTPSAIATQAASTRNALIRFSSAGTNYYSYGLLGNSSSVFQFSSEL